MADLEDVIELLTAADPDGGWRSTPGGLKRTTSPSDGVALQTMLMVSGNVLTCTVKFPGRVVPEHQLAMAEWLQRVNPTIVVGAFEVTKGQLLRVRAAVDIWGVALTGRLISNLIGQCESTAHNQWEPAGEHGHGLVMPGSITAPAALLGPRRFGEQLVGMSVSDAIRVIAQGDELSDDELITVVNNPKLSVWIRFWADAIARGRATVLEATLPDLGPSLIKLVSGDTSSFTPALVSLLGKHGPRSLIGPLRELANERGSPVPGVARAATRAADAIRARFIDGSAGGLSVLTNADKGKLSLPDTERADELPRV